MKALELYRWIAGSMADFTSQFKNNESLFRQAREYWSKLEATSVIILMIFIIVGITMTTLYYGPYNNLPGRHFRPIHWLYFLGATFLVTLLLTWCCVGCLEPSSLHGVDVLHFKLAIGNAIYASILYLIFSWVWCQLNLPTNACRIFKI